MVIFRKHNAFYPTFRGKHNKSKAKLLMVLYDARVNGGWKFYYFPRSVLALATGLSLLEVRILTWRLTNWRYIRCEEGWRSKSPGMINTYCIAPRGVKFIERVPSNVVEELAPGIVSRATEYNLFK